MSLFLMDIAIFAIVMGSLFLYLYKAPVRYIRYHTWKHVPIPGSVPFPELQERVRTQLQNRRLSSAGKDGDLIYFKETPSMYSWGNTYVISQNDGQHSTLYYRGSLIKWRVDKMNLDNMVFILGDASANDPS